MHQPSRSRTLLAALCLFGLLTASCRRQTASASSAVDVTWYGLESPRGHAIEQASDLCFGRIGDRGDLWTVGDRNGGESAARIYRFDTASLHAAKPGESVRAAEEFVVAPPANGWAQFHRQHAPLGPDVLRHIEERIGSGHNGTQGPRLDLEAVAIGPAVAQAAGSVAHPAPQSAGAAAQRSADAPDSRPASDPATGSAPETRVSTAARSVSDPAVDPKADAAVGEPADNHLFVVAEEPYSLILELALDDAPSTGRPPATAAGGPAPSPAVLVAAYRYLEREDEHGADLNDGLEALAYAGTPGRFWWGEEGTRLHKPDAHPRLFFAGARLGVGDLTAGAVKLDTPVSEAATRSFQAQQAGDAQTLNALAAMPDGSLAAVDRNGAWVLRFDPKSLTVSRWFNLYDFGGHDLRKSLAEFPGPRRMPYVSIEGIAVEPDGTLWLVDDPAMPESFRASCLVRIAGLPPPNAGG